MALGIELEYALGASQPGIESFFLHAAKVRFPIEACVDLPGGHRLGMGLGPLLEIDTMAQSKQYGSTKVEAAVVPGAAFTVRYEYTLTSTVSLGLAHNFDLALYSRPLFSYSPRLTIQVWLGQPAPEEGNR